MINCQSDNKIQEESQFNPATHQHVACNHVCFDRGMLAFPSCGVTSAVRLMTDVFRLSRARACPRQSVLKRVRLSLSIVCVCAHVRACVPLPSSMLTSLNSWLSLSSHSRGKIIQSALSSNTVWIHYRRGH